MAKTFKLPKNFFEKYAGKRVALVGDKVVYACRDAAEALKRAGEKFPHRKITIFHVPRKEDKDLLI